VLLLFGCCGMTISGAVVMAKGGGTNSVVMAATGVMTSRRGDPGGAITHGMGAGTVGVIMSHDIPSWVVVGVVHDGMIMGAGAGAVVVMMFLAASGTGDGAGAISARCCCGGGCGCLVVREVFLGKYRSSRKGVRAEVIISKDIS
jgi:hypothetical protein